METIRQQELMLYLVNMDTKAKCIITFIGFYVIIIFGSCGKLRLDCDKTTFNFKIAAKAYPDRDSIRIGDTIWIEINAPTNLTDITSNKVVDYSGAANLANALSIDRFTGGSFSNPGSVFAANDFSFILLSGFPVDSQPSGIDRIKAYLFKEDNKLYSLKLAVIPKKKGIYSIAISNGVNVYRQSDKCTKAAFEINFENTNQHLYLYQNNRPGYVISTYEHKHMYCFKVYQ